MIVHKCKDNNVIYQRTMFIVAQVSYRGIVLGQLKPRIDRHTLPPSGL